eukprot:SM000135S27021  [mRNA]  locus=s135:236440:236790:- [translate_table: standard]
MPSSGAPCGARPRAPPPRSPATPPTSPRLRPPLLVGKRQRDDLARSWNVAIDATLGSLVAALSSRGW